MNRKLKPAVAASMLAAMTAIATMIIRIPTPGTNGYVNIGDAVVLLSAWILGNPYGALAASIGSALADLLSGYPVYAPGTAVIKFLMAFTAAAIISAASKKKSPGVPARLVSGIVAELIMVSGYFMYEAVILGYGIAASASVISNAVQGIVCVVLGNLLAIPLIRTGYIGKMKS